MGCSVDDRADGTLGILVEEGVDMGTLGTLVGVDISGTLET